MLLSNWTIVLWGGEVSLVGGKMLLRNLLSSLVTVESIEVGYLSVSLFYTGFWFNGAHSHN